MEDQRLAQQATDGVEFTTDREPRGFADRIARFQIFELLCMSSAEVGLRRPISFIAWRQRPNQTVIDAIDYASNTQLICFLGPIPGCCLKRLAVYLRAQRASSRLWYLRRFRGFI